MENENTNIEQMEQNETTAKTYTQEEVDQLLQRESDRRVTEALKKAEKKKQEAIKEAEKLAKMNEQERMEHELKKREENILAKERELALAENKNSAIEALASRGIDVTLAGFVLAESAEETFENIKVLETAFKASVKAEVEKRLASTMPKKNFNEDTTKDDFKKLTLAQQQKMLNENPELWEKVYG